VFGSLLSALASSSWLFRDTWGREKKKESFLKALGRFNLTLRGFVAHARVSYPYRYETVRMRDKSPAVRPAGGYNSISRIPCVKRHFR
jgi:hypothetical protein